MKGVSKMFKKKFIGVFASFLLICSIFSIAFADINGGISQIDYSNFPEFSAYVIVTDGEGNFIRGLVPENFEVTEDGVPVEVTNVIPVEEMDDKTALSLSIVLAIDNSASMQRKEDELEKAANIFLDNLRLSDRVAIVEFQRGLSGGGETVHKFSNDKESLKKHTHINYFSDKTYLYDAVFHSADLLEGESPLGRRAIIAFSDGRDIGSEHSYEEAVLRAKEVETPVFTIELGRSRNRNKKLIQLAEETGGDYYFSPSPDKLVDLYSEITEQLFKQYRVSYVSEKTDIATPEREVDITIDVDGEILSSAKTILLDEDKVQLATAVYKGSKEELLALINQFPNSKWVDDMDYKLGSLYEEEGNFEEAQKYYQELVTKFPDSQWSEEAQFRLGNTYSETGDTEKALNAYQDLINSFPNSEWADDAILATGKLYEEQGDTDKANEFYGDILEKFPDSHWSDEVQFKLGKSYADAGDYEKAISNYQELAQKTESELKDKALFELGTIYAKQGDYEEAAKAFSSLSSNFPESDLNQEALFVLGMAYSQEGKYDKAEENFQKVITESPELANKARFELGAIYEKEEKNTEAIAVYEDILEASPDTILIPKAHYKIAYIYYQQEDWEKTRDHIMPIKDEYVNAECRPKALFILGETYLREENPEEAEKIYDILRTDYPDHKLTARIPEKTEEEKGELEFEQYIVKEGDCLWNISRKFLGDGKDWHQLYQINEGEISDPHWIYIDQKINIITRAKNNAIYPR